MKITKSNFTLHNIKRFFLAYYRKFQMWLLSRKMITSLFQYSDSLKDYSDSKNYIKEQFIWRLHKMSLSKDGQQCINKKECIHCGCAVPDLQLTNDACEGNCYPPMMDEKKWNSYKKLNHIKIDLNRQIVLKYIV